MPAVDIALILALDGSASVSYDEFGLMAGGLAAALRQPAVANGLTGGRLGASLGAVLVFSGVGAQEVMIDWTRIATPADVASFADRVDNIPRIVRPGLTAIGEALIAAETLLQKSPAEASRRIVDIVGDGRSNDGVPPNRVRDRLAGAGVTINGLCILHEEPDLLDYFTAEVIGGPDAFAVICQDYAGFADAIAQKLTRELVS
jgi:hypothetical protein